MINVAAANEVKADEKGSNALSLLRLGKDVQFGNISQIYLAHWSLLVEAIEVTECRINIVFDVT